MTIKPFLITALLALAAFSPAQAITFNQALSLAKSNRSLLNAARLQTAQAAAEAAASSSLTPLSLGIGASLPGGFGPTDQDLSLQQGLDLFGRRSALRSLGAAKVLEAKAQEAEAHLVVQTETITAFIEAAAARDSLTLAKDLTALSRDLVAAATRRFEEGRTPEVQVSRSKIELERSLLTEKSWTAQHEASLKRLAAALGGPEVQAVTGEAVLEAPLSLTQKPELLALRAKIDAAEAEARVARSSNQPQTALSLHRSPWEEDSRFGLRLQVTWNLHDGGRAKSERQAAEAKKASFEASYKDALRLAEAEDASLAIEVASGHSEVKTLQGLVNDLRSLEEKTKRGFSEGVGTMVEVLEAIRALREVELELIAAKKKVSLLQAARLRSGGILLEGMK